MKRLTTALKRVDFPTLGRPTIPAFKLMLILEFEEKRRRKPMEREVSEKQIEDVLVKKEDFNGSATIWWHAILAISAQLMLLQEK